MVDGVSFGDGFDLGKIFERHFAPRANHVLSDLFLHRAEESAQLFVLCAPGLACREG